MSKNEPLQIMLAQNHSSSLAPKMSQPLTESNNKLRQPQELNRSPVPSPKESETLGNQEANELVAGAVLPNNKKKNNTPTTAPEFLRSLMPWWPYQYDMVADSEKAVLDDASEEISASTTPVSESVQNQGLQDTFSATRYFSDDKKSVANISADKGSFTAQFKHLNPAGKVDVAFEVSFQCLMNLKPNQKSVALSGRPEEMFHKLYAAFLSLQQQAGPNSRFAGIKFNIPKEFEGKVPQQFDEAYVNQHLGSTRPRTRQVIQWDFFLKLKPNPDDYPKDLPFKEQVDNFISLENIAKATDLSQEDKNQLSAYHRFLKEEYGFPKTDNADENTKLGIAAQEQFMKNTEEALRILKKSPLLKSSFDNLKNLYVRVIEGEQNSLTELHQNTVALEQKEAETLIQKRSEQKKSLNAVIQYLGSLLHESKDQTEKTLQQATELEQISQSLQNDTATTDEKLASCIEKASKTLELLEETGNYSHLEKFHITKQTLNMWSDEQSSLTSKRLLQLSQQFKERLQAFKQEFEQPKVKLDTPKTVSQELTQASQFKERLNEFKIEMQVPRNSEAQAPALPLTSEFTEQLSSLVEKLDQFIKEMETEDEESVLKSLCDDLEKMSTSTSATSSERDALNQKLEKAQPHIESNKRLVKAFAEVQEQLASPSEMLSSPEEHQTTRGLNM